MLNISNIIIWFQTNAVPLFFTLVLLFMAYKITILVAARAMKVALRALGDSGRAKAEFIFSAAVLRIIRIGFVILLILYISPFLGINMGPLLAGLGIGGIALGFASQLLVRDVISGIVLLGENRFKKGDKISISGIKGTVEDFDLRGIYVKGEDAENHYIPFGEIRILTKY